MSALSGLAKGSETVRDYLSHGSDENQGAVFRYICLRIFPTASRKFAVDICKYQSPNQPFLGNGPGKGLSHGDQDEDYGNHRTRTQNDPRLCRTVF